MNFFLVGPVYKNIYDALFSYEKLHDNRSAEEERLTTRNSRFDCSFIFLHERKLDYTRLF